ncbi:hypothetical protein vseg_019316 [Gypsophila vaccaria]
MSLLSTTIPPNLHPFIKFTKNPTQKSNIKPSKTLIPKNPLQISSLLPQPTKKVTTFIAKSAVKLLLGTVILAGTFNCNVAKAEPKDEAETLEEMQVKMLETDPRNAEYLKRVVDVKMRRGKTKEAVKYVEKLVEIESDEVEWRLLEALCYEMMGNFSKSKRLFRDVLRDFPLLLRALHGLAMVMHKNHEGSAVFDMLNRALELARRERRVVEERNIRILIAQMYLVKGDFDEASKQYQELINENPRDFRPYLCQGIIYSLQDKKKEADEQFEIYRNLVPEEFPQRGFLEDVVLAAKNESREQLEKEFKVHFSSKE